MPYYISPPPQNPLSRFIAAIIAVLVLVGTFIIGAAAFLVIAGLGLIAGLALWARVAWVKRRLIKSGVDLGAGPIPRRESGDVIDAEYTVVSVQENESEK